MEVFQFRLAGCEEGEVWVLVREVARNDTNQGDGSPLMLALSQAAQPIVVTRRDEIITYVNTAFEQLTGYAGGGEVFGQTLGFLEAGDQDRSSTRKYWETLLSGGIWQGEKIHRRKDRTLYVEEQTIATVRDERGEIVQFILIARDASERKGREEQSQREIQRLQVLTEINHTVASSLDIERLIDIVLERVDLARSYAAVLLWLPDRDRDEWDLVACRSFDGKKMGSQQIRGQSAAAP